MQVKKEDVKNKILAVAQKEFLKLGFQKASLREIARKANVTKGNIYTYFNSKDDLFCALVKPAMDIFIENLYSNYEDMYYEDVLNEVYSQEKSLAGFYKHARIINENRDAIKLLFFCSDGSSYSNYREKIAINYEKSFREFNKVMGKVKEDFSNNISYMFLHTCSQLYISFIEEILIHNPDEEELRCYIKEMSTFISSGMKGILKL